MEVVRKRIAALKEELEEKENAVDELSMMLKQEQAVRSNIEEENRSLSHKLQLVEDCLCKTNSKLEKAQSEISILEDERNKNDEILKSIIDQEQNVTDQYDFQAEELKEAKMIAEDADRKYEEVARKLTMVKENIKRVETQAEETELENKQLYEEVQELAAVVKAYEAKEGHWNDEEIRQDRAIEDLTKQLNECEIAKEEAEKECARLRKEVDSNKADSRKVVDETAKIEKELQTMIEDLANL